MTSETVTTATFKKVGLAATCPFPPPPPPHLYAVLRTSYKIVVYISPFYAVCYDYPAWLELSRGSYIRQQSCKLPLCFFS